MFALTPIAPHLFDKLIAKSEHNRRQMKQRGQLAPLITATPEQRADGLWREQIFIAADALILVAIDMLIAAGAKRAAIDHVMRDLQLEIISRLNDIDAGKATVLCFAHDANGWVALTASCVANAMKSIASHFRAIDKTLTTFGVAEAPKVALFVVPLHEALAIVRARAAEHDIEFPDRIWLTPEELDAGADLLGAAIAPRVSPVIEQWKAMRDREATPTVPVS